MKENVSLDRLLGRREAFSFVAGQCAAADVVQLREVREKKLYLERAADWPEFCVHHLNMSKDAANRLIRNLEEFGPTYFLLTQFTQVSPKVYRAIAPAIENDKLHFNGEAIALIPENAGKVTAAVAELRKTVTVKAEPEPAAPEPAEPEDPIVVLGRECSALAAKLEQAISRLRHRPEYMRAVVLGLRDRLNRMDMTI